MGPLAAIADIDVAIMNVMRQHVKAVGTASGSPANHS